MSQPLGDKASGHQVPEKVLFFCPLDGREERLEDRFEAEKKFGCRGCGYCDYEYPPTKEEWLSG